MCPWVRLEVGAARTKPALLRPTRSWRKIYGELPAWIAAAVEGLPVHEELVDLR